MILCLSLAPSRPAVANPVPVRAPEPVLALLGSGALVRVASSGVVRVAQLSDGPIEYTGTGPFLASVADAVYVGVPTEGRVYRIADDTRPRAVFKLPRRSALQGLVAGPVSGQLYLVSNDERGDGTASVIVRVVDPRGERLISQTRVKSPGASVFSVAIAPDEQRLAVSYHGDAEGFDVLDTALQRTCQTASVDGCFQGHGSVIFAGSSLFSSTGRPTIAELPSQGPPRGLESRLPGNHFLEFAAVGAQQLYLAGRCGYAGGLASVNLATRVVRVLSRDRRVCGSRVIVAGRWIALAANVVPVPRPASRSRVLLIRRDAPRVRRSVALNAAVIDLLAVS